MIKSKSRHNQKHLQDKSAKSIHGTQVAVADCAAVHEQVCFAASDAELAFSASAAC
jgi:hypothetical protein